MLKTKPTYEELLKGDVNTKEKPTFEDILTFSTAKPTYEEIIGKVYDAPTEWLRGQEVPEVLAEQKTRGIGLGPMWDDPGDTRTMRERMGYAKKKPPTAADAAQAIVETPENLWIGTVGMSASVFEALKREGMRYAGGGILPDEAVRHQFEVVKPPEILPPTGQPLPGALTAEAFGLMTRGPDAAAKIIRDYQQKKMAKQAQVTLADAPITKLARSVTQSGIPSMSVALGLSILTKNPMVGLAILGTIEGGAAFETQLQEGGSIRKSMLIGDLSAAAEIGGEMLVFPKFVKGLKEGIPFTKALTLIVENAGQEGATGFTQRFLEVFGTETTKGTEITDAARMAFDEGVKAIPENAWVGGATAGLVDLVSTGTSRMLKAPDLKNQIEKKIGVSPKVAERTAEMLKEGWTPAEIDRNLITPSKFLGDKAIDQVAAKERPRTTEDRQVEAEIAELDREYLEITGETPATVGVQAPDIAPERLLADKGAEIPSEEPEVAPEKIIHTIRKSTPEEIAEDKVFWENFDKIKKAVHVPTVEALSDTLGKRIDLLKKVQLGILTQQEADALTKKFAEAAKLRIESKKEAKQAPKVTATQKTIEDLRVKISDEELSGITKPERRKLIKENLAKIEQSDIYQSEVAGMETAAREVGPGYYYIDKGYRGEVEAIIGKRKGFPTKVRAMFTFDPNAKRIITLQDGTKAEVGPTPWESAVQEGLGRGKEGVDQTWGEMDISEFVQRVVDSYLAQETIGGANKLALERAEESGRPDEQLLAEKHRMLVAGYSDQQINEMVAEWAAEWGIDIEDIADEFVAEYGPKLRQIKKMEDPWPALEQLAAEQIEKEDRQTAADNAREVLEANDIKAEVEQIEEIPDRPTDLIGRPLLEGGAAGKQRGLGELGLEFTKPEAIDPDQLEFGDKIPFERRGKPVGAAITRGQEQVILLAYGADSETGYHEGYHILRRRLTEKNTKVLDKYFKGEEAEASAFAEYVKTGKTQTFLRGIWQKLRNLLRKIRSGLLGRGLRTAEDIFGEIRRGTVEKKTAKGGIQFETRGEILRREAEKNARVKARAARLAAQAGVKKRRVRQAPRFQIKLRDYTPLLREDLAEAPLPPGKTVMFREPKFRRTLPVSDKPVPKDVLAANRQNQRIKDSLKEIKRQTWKMGEGIERASNSISSRLFNFNPELKRRIRDLEEVKLGRMARDLRDIEPLLRAFKKMKGQDWKDMDLFIKNGDVVGIEEMVKKYNLQGMMEKFREVDDAIYDAANEVGMEVDHRKGHFHRRVSQPKELMAYIKKTYGNTAIMTRFEAALAKRKEKAGGRLLTKEEKAQVLNSVLRGYGGRHIWLSKPGGAKERSLFFIDSEINKFYYDTKQALEMYVRNMHEAIAEREFFGRETKQIQRLRALKARLATSLHKLQTKQGLRGAMDEPRYKEHISKRWAKLQEVTQQLEDLKHQDITQTIGGHIIDLVNEGLITDPQQDKVQSALEAYFNPRPLSPRASFAKKIAYMTHIGSPIQTATQLKDYGRALYRAPLQVPGATARVLLGRPKYTMEELGLTDISVDMASVGGLLNKNLRVTGFRKLDMMMKEMYGDAVLTQFQQRAKRPGPVFIERLQEVFGNDTQQVINDLKAGRKTALTKKLIFNQILDMHPVARSEMTETYLKGGGITKYMYTLRTFGLKEFEYARNEIFRDMKKQPVRSLERLAWLAFTVALAGAGVETLKDLMRGRKTKLPDKILDSWLNMIFMSRYGIDILRREGPGRGVARLVTPPTRHIDAPVRDIFKGEFSETPRNIPIGGEFYYYWFGEGRRKIEKQEKKSPVD